ncbi:MAG: tRNA lysidine(34) synthetase TilS [Planctomycetota bacterium]
MFEENALQINLSLLEGIDRVLLAVSGGADSVAMVHALAEFKKRGALSCELAIGHVNHCLRGAESDMDDAFVQQLGQSLGIPVVSQSVDVKAYAQTHKLSIETAGRALRLRTLAEMAEIHDCDHIATAHHADDQAETLIHRLMRGTGFRGLCGIKPISVINGNAYIRPMLNVRRSEIIQYCRDNSIHWCEDVSNASLTYTRNRIRHQLLPQLQVDADLVKPLNRLSIAAQDLQKRVEKALEDSLNELSAGVSGSYQVSFKRERLRSCSPWTFYEITRHSIMTLGTGLRDYSQEHFNAIREMLNQPKAKASFPGGIEVIVDHENVLIQAAVQDDSSEFEPVSLPIGQTVNFGPWQISSRMLNAADVDLARFVKTKNAFVEWFDADKICGPLEIRLRRNGDRFHPIGAAGKKKVGRFLIDAGLNPQTKNRVFIIKDTENILWVVPVRMSESGKITPKTHNICELRVDLPGFQNENLDNPA